MSDVEREISYGFRFTKRPIDLDVLIAELVTGRRIIQGKAEVNVTGYDNQHDGFDLSFDITGDPGDTTK